MDAGTHRAPECEIPTKVKGAESVSRPGAFFAGLDQRFRRRRRLVNNVGSVGSGTVTDETPG